MTLRSDILNWCILFSRSSRHGCFRRAGFYALCFVCSDSVLLALREVRLGCLCMKGFLSNAFAAGGIAAWAQGFFFGGVVQKGSWFALLQNAGMTPIGAPIKNGIIGAVTGAVGFIAGFL